MAIMNSWHKVVRSIRNTTWKLCTDCKKQFVRNVQNCGETNRGFCTMITHRLTHRCLCVSLWPKKHINHASTTVFTELGPRWLFPFPIAEDADGRKAFCYDWRDKRKIETGTVRDTNKHVSEVLRRLEKKTLLSVYYIWGGGVTLKGDKIVVDK